MGINNSLDQAVVLKIVAMSGNFMQRGEPAIVDKKYAQMQLEKWSRSSSGMVLFLASVQAAAFGQGAMDILVHSIDSSFRDRELSEIADLYTRY